MNIVHRLKEARAKLFYVFFNFYEKLTGHTVTFRTRPLYSTDITHTAEELKYLPKCAIVLQGQVMKKHDFTLETVRIYKKVYPDLTTIISTWEDEDPRYLDQLKEAGADVVLNKKPEYFGTWNINLQIESTRNGIARAKDLGIPYVIKSRTDNRMYAKNALETLHNLVSYFKPAQWCGLHKRIVVSHKAYKYSDGYFPDMFMFGDTNDLFEYWSVPLLKKESNFKEFLSELYLTHSFRKRKGWPALDSVQTVWETYRDCIIVVDWNDLDILWPKYEYFWDNLYTRNDKYKQLTAVHRFVDLSFNDWFNIFSAADNKIISPALKTQFDNLQLAVNFSDYERNYEHQSNSL